MIIQVLVPKPFDEAFDYTVPEGMSVQLGDYVQVPFGRQTLWGVVWSAEAATAPKDKIKAILEVSDLPPMPSGLRETIGWTAEYTMSPLGSVAQMAVSVPAAFEALKRPRKEKGAPADNPPKPYALNDEQQAAVKQLTKTNDHHVTLIDGVTGSGKTAVYFEQIAAQLEAGNQALVLLPEIALTTQFVARFKEHFGFAPTLWHSQLTPATRRENWKAIAKGEARLVVGARSALFLPFKSLGVIVVDEEHEAAYKQEDGVPYHARDMAVVRGKFENIPVTLVSASPSMESVWNVQHGKYEVVHLHERYGDAAMPDIELVDMREEQLTAQEFISKPLRDALAHNLAAGNQSLLFLNRRGFAPLTLCRTCGYRFESPDASAWMVLHRKGGGVEARTERSREPSAREAAPHGEGQKAGAGGNPYFLKCHHTGYTMPLPQKCPACDAEDSFAACGPGVERLEEEVKAILPQARVIQMTSDTMSSAKEAEAIITQVESGEVDIIIGTQMVAKGHHFPKLTLVGVVDADLGLDGGNVRAGERTYQLLHQVSGRAGRELEKGKVLIQTYQPEHGVMHALLADKKHHFADEELARRERGHLPPFSRMAAIILSGLNEKAVEQTARNMLRIAPQGTGYRILGPVEAPMYKLRNRYRWRFLIITDREVSPQKLITHWLSQANIPPSIACKIDIDPQSLL